MKVAITGANGFLAGYLLDELLAHGHQVLLLSRGSGARNGQPFAATDYSADSLCGLFGSGGVDAVAHLASSRKVADRFGFYSGLVETTENIYAAAGQCGISNVVFTSSISVYSGEALPYSESTPPAPANRYGLYKLACELVGGIFARSGLNVKNLRLAHIDGANEQNNYMINRFFRQAHAHERLFVPCRSVAQREMLYAKDAARAIRLALEHESFSGVCNVGSGQPLTNAEIARTIASVMSPELEVSLGEEPETIVSSYMDGSKAAECLGYVPRYTLREATAEIAADMEKAASAGSGALPHV